MRNGNRARIMVVDNSVDAADSLTLLLSIWEHNAVACYSGTEALQKAETFSPDIVLLDIAMPKMDGFEIARRLRQQSQSRHAELIAYTGCTDDTCRSRAREMGFSEYVVKPANLSQLQELLSRATSQDGDQAAAR